MKRLTSMSLVFLSCVGSTTSIGSFATTATPPSDAGAVTQVCATDLIADGLMPSFSHFGEAYTLDDLPSMMKAYPTLAMNAAQLYAGILRRYPARVIRDPSYRVSKMLEYPLFADGVKETGGLRIIGQHEAIDSFADWVQGRAEGRRSSKMFVFLGPAGTGKTQVLNMIDRANAYIAMTEDPQFTFEFTEAIGNVPALRPLVGKARELGMPLLRYIGGNRSPLVLVPPSMQKALTDMASPEVQKRIGARAMPFLTPTPQTLEVVKMIVAHEMKERGIVGAPSQREYYEMIKPYVRIVRRAYDLDQPSVIVRVQGKSPELGPLLVQENLQLSTWYTPASALSYHYNGQIVRAGPGLLMDEFRRQDNGLRNIFLEVVQNGVVEYAGAPPIALDVVPVAADNDESVDAATEEGAAIAQNDRTKPKPMRLLREPQYVMKLAIEMLKPSLFSYRATSEPETDTKPFDMNVVFPNANERGELPLPDGKYAIYYNPTESKRVLFAPRALTLMALTVAGTRLEVDPAKMEKLARLVPSYQQFPQYFLDPIARLRVLLGKDQPEPAVAIDLTKLRKITKEGANGITSRDAEMWLNEITKEAERANSPITPLIVDRAFINLMDDDEIKGKKGAYDAWNRLHQRVKAEFILPMLTEDVSAIISGDSGRVERMYDEIKGELKALDTDDKAAVYFPGGERTPINFDRLRQIEALFRKMHNKELGGGLLKNFGIDVTVEEKRYQPLLDTITRWMMIQEFNTTMLTDIVNFFKNKTVNEKARMMALHAEGNLAAHGYDRESFMQALLFVRDQQAELKAQLR